MSGGEVTMHELDDERPIPLGRAATAATHDADGNRSSETNGWSGAAELESRSPAHIEKTREEPATAAAVVAASTPPPATGPPKPRGEAVAPAAIEAATSTAPADHPLAALRGFRMEVEVTERRRPRGCARDLGCFLTGWLLTVAFVLALIAAFNALTTQLGSAHP
jgi:hypothetical protein